MADKILYPVSLSLDESDFALLARAGVVYDAPRPFRVSVRLSGVHFDAIETILAGLELPAGVTVSRSRGLAIRHALHRFIGGLTAPGYVELSPLVRDALLWAGGAPVDSDPALAIFSKRAFLRRLRS